MSKEDLEEKVQEATKYLTIQYAHMFLRGYFNEKTSDEEIINYTDHIISLYSVKKYLHRHIKKNAAVETFKIFLLGDKSYLITHKETEYTLRDIKLARLILKKFDININDEIKEHIQSAISEYKKEITSNPKVLRDVFGELIKYS